VELYLGTGKMPVPQNLIFLWNGHLAPWLGTGKMPVPQNLIFLWNFI